MRINDLHVSNFRAITELRLRDLQNTVVIAGPNGCGKSCLFDAIRLLKSVYGGYQPNEWHNWFGEFQINVNSRNANMLPLFQDRSRPVIVGATFQLSNTEKDYLKENAERILAEKNWQEVVPELRNWLSNLGPLAANLRVHKPVVDQRVREQMPRFLEGIEQQNHFGQVIIPVEGQLMIEQSLVLELVFGRYDPPNIGIIDYHGSTRNYSRSRSVGLT